MTLRDPVANGKVVAHAQAVGSLFAHEPAPTDVNQGMIGNCWQLASINAILARPAGPFHIMSAMTDSPVGSVTIRLYIDGAWRFYQVKRTVYKRTFGPAQRSSGALWVNMLEKALLVLLSQGDYGREKGGESRKALEALLGPTGQGAASDEGDAMSLLNNLLSYAYRGSTLPSSKAAPLQTNATKGIFNEDGGSFDQFYRWNSSNKAGHWSTLSANKRSLAALRKHLEGLDQVAANAIIGYAIGYDALPGEQRSGYALTQLGVYTKISTALAMRKAVTASTSERLSTGTKSVFEKLAGKVAGAMTGATAGEFRQAGIFGTHAYSVVATGPRAEKLGIVLRNPHGKGGRKYTADGEAVSTKAAEFWIELADFCTDFTYDIGAAVQTSAQANFMGSLGSELQKAVLAPNARLGS